MKCPKKGKIEPLLIIKYVIFELKKKEK